MQASADGAGICRTVQAGHHCSVNVSKHSCWVPPCMLDQPSVLSLHASSTSPSSFTSLLCALGYPLVPTVCYGDTHMASMARFIRPSSFPDPDDATPLQHIQLHKLLVNFTPWHTSLGKAATNRTAQICMLSTCNRTPLYSQSGMVIGLLLVCITCVDGRDTGIICMSHDVQPTQQVLFLSVDTFWLQLFL